jgi:hypothetical protein
MWMRGGHSRGEGSKTSAKAERLRKLEKKWQWQKEGLGFNLIPRFYGSVGVGTQQSTAMHFEDWSTDRLATTVKSLCPYIHHGGNTKWKKKSDHGIQIKKRGKKESALG